MPRYVTHPSLGDLGRLGNQLWQLSAVIARAELTDALPAIRPDWKFREAFDLTAVVQAEDLDGDIETLEGYQQDYSNLRPSLPRIRRSLQFTELIKKRAATDYSMLPTRRDVAVHVRRGDYMRLSHAFHILPAGYYSRAVERLNAQGVEFDRLLLFSDDLELAETVAPAGAIRVEPRAGCIWPHVSEMYLMSQCGAHIIANSTFSWWGAFLSNQNQVAYPDYWATPRLRLHDRWRDSMPADWWEVESRV